MLPLIELCPALHCLMLCRCSSAVNSVTISRAYTDWIMCSSTASCLMVYNTHWWIAPRGHKGPHIFTYNITGARIASLLLDHVFTLDHLFTKKTFSHQSPVHNDHLCTHCSICELQQILRTVPYVHEPITCPWTIPHVHERYQMLLNDTKCSWTIPFAYERYHTLMNDTTCSWTIPHANELSY